MVHVRFFPGFMITCVTVLLLVVGSSFLFPALANHVPFTVVSLLVFAGLALGIYYSSRPAANSENAARLAQYVMVLTFVKMLVSASMVFAYYKLFKPESRTFLIPFFIGYFAFTLFETLWLVGLNKRVSAAASNKAVAVEE